MLKSSWVVLLIWLFFFLDHENCDLFKGLVWPSSNRGTSFVSLWITWNFSFKDVPTYILNVYLKYYINQPPCHHPSSIIIHHHPPIKLSSSNGSNPPRRRKLVAWVGIVSMKWIWSPSASTKKNTGRATLCHRVCATGELSQGIFWSFCCLNLFRIVSFDKLLSMLNGKSGSRHSDCFHFFQTT